MIIIIPLHDTLCVKITNKQYSEAVLTRTPFYDICFSFFLKKKLLKYRYWTLLNNQIMPEYEYPKPGK